MKNETRYKNIKTKILAVPPENLTSGSIITSVAKGDEIMWKTLERNSKLFFSKNSFYSSTKSKQLYSVVIPLKNMACRDLLD